MSEDDRLVEIRRRTEHLEGCVTPQRLERFRHAASERLTSVTVVLENFWDAHNVSAVIRSAEGLGLSAAHVVESPYRYRGNRAILRGADRWLHVHRHPSIDACLETISAAGFVTCAADVGEGCLELDELPVDRPLAIVMGTERHGLSVEAKHLTDLRYTIPMQGLTESFNVSVSAAVSLFHLTTARRRRFGSDLSVEECAAKIERWVEISTNSLQPQR
ncbi:MAG: RNA methyltransferase [Acidobacteriota bacterium]